MKLQSTVLCLNCFAQIGEDIKKGLGVAPEDSDLKKSQDRLQKLLMLVNAWLCICSICIFFCFSHYQMFPGKRVAGSLNSTHAIFSQSPTEDKAKRRSEESLLQDVWMKAGSWPHRREPWCRSLQITCDLSPAAGKITCLAKESCAETTGPRCTVFGAEPTCYILLYSCLTNVPVNQLTL